MHSAWKASLKEIEGFFSGFFILFIFLLIFKEFLWVFLFNEILDKKGRWLIITQPPLLIMCLE